MKNAPYRFLLLILVFGVFTVRCLLLLFVACSCFEIELILFYSLPFAALCEDAKWKKSELVVVAAPGPISPLKAALGLSVIHFMPGAQCRGPETSRTPQTGRQTETFKTTTAHASNRSTFFHFT